MNLIIHRYLPVTTVEGPEKRFCLWVQGCSIRCEGCGVPWTWAKENGETISIEEIHEEIKKSQKEHNIEGVTFLGGEPFDQPEALGELAGLVQKLGLSVMSFSGYLIEDLRGRPECQKLLNNVDLLIDGPFVQEKLDLSRPWSGSSNQRYHFLTSRYYHLQKDLKNIVNKVEVRVGEDGAVSINGMITQQTLSELFDAKEFKKVKKSPKNFL